MKLRYFITSIIVLFCVCAFAGELPTAPKAKTVIISGKISDTQSNELLAGVKIVCSNCQKSFYSDLNGNFFIVLEVYTAEDVKLEFSQIGYSSKTFNLQELQAAQGTVSVSLKAE